MMAPQKRSASEADSLLIGVKSIVFDIEGTTTPISFTKERLFPYVKDNIEKFLTDKFEDAETLKDVAALRDLVKKEKDDDVQGVVDIPDAESGKDEVVKAVCANVRRQMDCDCKSTELKQLQGHIWRHGYECGEIKGEVFEDVPPMLRMLSEEGYMLNIFSSGSIEAQKLLFSHLGGENITELFTNFFDTTTGSKTDVESYKKIAAEIKCPAEEILFLTDLPAEAEAAVGAGMRSALVIRPGNADLTDEHLQNFACIEQFDELYGDEDEEDIKRLHADDNGEAEDDDEEDENEDEVDEDEEGEEEEGEGDDA